MIHPRAIEPAWPTFAQNSIGLGSAGALVYPFDPAPLGAVADATQLHNPCGGRRWRTLPDGRIEVEGVGVPSATPGSDRYRLVGQTWNNWKHEFRQAGREYGIPPAMLAAIAYVETGAWSDDPALQARIESADGFHSIGIMQPIPSTTTMLGFQLNDRYDPLNNIRMGAKLARMNADKYGLDFPLLAASHNAGSVKCRPGENQWNVHTYGDYIQTAVPAHNALIEHFGANRFMLLGSIPWSYAAGGAVAGAGLIWALTAILAPTART